MEESIRRYWETLRLQVAFKDGTTRAKDQLRRSADCVRALMVLNEELRLRNQLTTVTSHAASEEQWKTYSATIDSLDERGLNSYADVIINQTTGLRNEGKSWKSTLSANSAYSLIRNENSELMNFEGTSDWYQEELFREDESRHPYQQLPGSRMKERGPSSTYLPSFNDQTGSAGNRCTSSFQQNLTISEQFPRKANDARENEDHRNTKAVGFPGQERRILQNGHEPKFSWKQREKMYWKEREGISARKPDYSNNGLTHGKHMTSEPESSDVDKGKTLFKTAKEQYIINQRKEGKKNDNGGDQISANSYGTTKKSLGTRRGPSSRFVPPIMRKSDDASDYGSMQRTSRNREMPKTNGIEEVDDKLKNIDPKMIELIESEIMDHGPPIHWDDIAGLDFAKSTIQEIVVWPMLRPDIFHGLRGPPKGLLLFGPPGTGKTLIGKCIASQSHATFFSISASSLTSKWVGEGEKMVRALFAVARCHSPAVIFIDEIDSLLTQRMDGEHESSRRIKTEFLVQLDGTTTKAEERFLVIGATNRPQELDEAARRRLVKRLYIPLPEPEARKHIVKNLMREQKANLTEENYNAIMNLTCGYSGADMSNLCREAALGPIRSIAGEDIRFITTDEVRSIEFADFQEALKHVRPSVCDKDLEVYIEWNRKFGSGTGI